MMILPWQVKKFAQLTTNELYDILKLRIDVFVVEQTCYYPDLDNKDRAEGTIHLFAYQENEKADKNTNGSEPKQLAGYLRILPPGVEYETYVAIGRVIVAESVRGIGLGHQIINQAINICQQYWPDKQIKISAQQHLCAFYQQHGFNICSEMYLEDGIPHISMIRDNS
jgi:ElaA protein